MEIPYEVLIRYCQNQTSQEENQEVEQWLSVDANYQLLTALKQEWYFIDDPTLVTPDRNRIWQTIKGNVLVKDKANTTQLNLYKIVAAASVILAFSVTIIFLILQRKTIQPDMYTAISTGKHEKTMVELADGTRIWLNNGSFVSFNNLYNIDNREITAKGELFLDVKTSGKTFIIHAEKIQVEVVGTAFNFKTSGIDDHIEISMMRGKIAVMDSTRKQQLFMLDSSQYAIINKGDMSYTIHSAETLQCNIWMQDNLQIYNEPWGSIINKLEYWYGVEIKSFGLDTTKRYTFDIQNETIDEFLENLSAMMPVKYTVSGKKISIEAIDE